MGDEGTADASPGTELVDLWLGLITALVLAGLGIAAASLVYPPAEETAGWWPVAVLVAVALLLATPLAAAWGSRRPDWQGAGLRGVGAGLLGALLALPLVHGVAAVAGVPVPSPNVLLAATGGIGASVAVAPRATGPWSLSARVLAVAVVLVAPLGVLAAGEVLGPSPSAVARSLWTTAPLGVIPMIGLADFFVHAWTRRRDGEAPE